MIDIYKYNLITKYNLAFKHLILIYANIVQVANR